MEKLLYHAVRSPIHQRMLIGKIDPSRLQSTALCAADEPDSEAFSFVGNHQRIH